MQGIKHKFDLTELITGRAYTQLLKKKVRTSKNPASIAWLWIENWFDYSDLLHNTPITQELFVGDKAIFEGWEFVVNTHNWPIYKNELLKLTFSIERIFLEFNSPLFDKFELPVTLFDLAELTKQNPLKLK